MASLTPESRREEVTASAFNNGMINGAMMFVPTLGGLWLAMKNPRFRQLTNAQSRTALAIMPPFFTFGLTSEQQLTNRMHEVASENEHNIEVRARSVCLVEESYHALQSIFRGIDRICLQLVCCIILR